MCKAIETFLKLRPHAMNEIAREVPIVQRVTDMDHAAEGPAQAGKNRQPQHRGANHVKWQSDVDDQEAGRRNRQPHHSEDVDQRGEKKCAVTPGHDKITDDGTRQYKFQERGDAQRKTPPIAHRRIGGDEIIPAKPVEIGAHAPIRTPGFDGPIGHRALRREPRWRYLALHVPGLLEPGHFPNKAAMLVFRPDRLVAGHLHEAPLAYERVRHWPLSGRSLRQPGTRNQACRASPASRAGALNSCATATKYGFLRRPRAAANRAAAVELTGVLRYTGRSQMRGPDATGLARAGLGRRFFFDRPKSTPDVHHVR